jgi:GTP-binding protein
VKHNIINYIIGTNRLSHLPLDSGIEVAFYGKSNSGKSSVIDLLIRKNLARVGKSPGSTKLIHFFQLGNSVKLIDLPGYGYAKSFKRCRVSWSNIISCYLMERRSLRGLVLLLDVRNYITKMDAFVLKLVTSYELSLHCLFTKVDKMKHNDILYVRDIFQQYLSYFSCLDGVTCQAFSSHEKVGVFILERLLNRWYNF